MSLTIRDELTKAGINALFPDSPAYLSPTPRNRRMTVYPEGITFPTSPEQVAKVVELCNKYKQRVVALSGGHGSIANSIGGFHGALVIDLAKLKKVDYNSSTKRITFQTGCRLADVIKALEKHNRAIPHGTCGTVGLGGHSAFGGFGLASRMWGLNCDSIYSMNVVTDDGTQKVSSSTTNPDLFWAMRGAAPSFAIATSLTYNTHPAPEVVDDYYHSVSMTAQAAASTFELIQDQVDDIHLFPKELGFQFRVDKGDKPGEVTVIITGTEYGQEATHHRVIEPVLKKTLGDRAAETTRVSDANNEGIPFPPPHPDTNHYAVTIRGNHFSSVARTAADPLLNGDSVALAKALGPHVAHSTSKEAAVRHHVNRVFRSGLPKQAQADSTVSAAPATPASPDPPVSFYIKSLMTPILNHAAITAFFQYVSRKESFEIPLNWFVAFKLVGGRDSVMPTAGSNSFRWRDACWMIEFNADARVPPPYPEYGYTFLDDMVKTITSNMPDAKFGAYPGFGDDRLENFNDMYYGANYTRLKEIRSTSATTGVFVFPQSI